MSDIAFIGDRDTVWGFGAFGIRAIPVVGRDEAREAFSTAVKESTAVIFVTEDVHEHCEDLIAEHRDAALPAITVLPSVHGSRGTAATEIHRAVSAAVGADILTEKAGEE